MADVDTMAAISTALVMLARLRDNIHPSLSFSTVLYVCVCSVCVTFYTEGPFYQRRRRTWQSTPLEQWPSASQPRVQTSYIDDTTATTRKCASSRRRCHRPTSRQRRRRNPTQNRKNNNTEDVGTSEGGWGEEREKMENNSSNPTPQQLSKRISIYHEARDWESTGPDQFDYFFFLVVPFFNFFFLSFVSFHFRQPTAC